MAWKIQNGCSEPGCPRLSISGSQYCTIHERQHRLSEKRKRKLTHSKYYDSSEWKKLSKRFLDANPMCELCEKRSEIAHHIIPRKQGGSDEVGNLMAVCRSCHGRIHHKDKVNQQKRYTY